MARKKRPKIETKEGLIKYLKENEKTEFPFCEKVWDLAVEKTADKERQFKEVVETDFDGNTKTKKIPNGALNPVSKYFQLMALPQYKKQGEALKKELEYERKHSGRSNKKNITIDDILDDLDDTEEDMFIAELISIYFSGYSGDDLVTIASRLSDYYTNYEFNEGSDKFLVVSAVADEIKLKSLYKKRAKGAVDENEVKKVRDSYMSALDGLKLLKKQGGKLEQGKNKLTMWVDELERAGELTIKFEDYEDDKIGKLLKDYREGLRNTFYEG